MGKHILVIQGHPDTGTPHFCHALGDAYAEAALAAGHEVRRIDVGALDFPVVRSVADWSGGTPSPGIAAAQQNVSWAEHLVFVYPLWLGGMPALLKAFLEQVARPGFAFGSEPTSTPFEKKLAGRSARIVITMGMPSLVFRWYFGAHSLKSLERNILGFIGIRPIRETLIGSVEAISPARRTAWLVKMRRLGAAAG